ncbi:hypothetical protein VB738_12745 [Cyanobium gracile UHCC 0139]|uniref:GIY-YIG domain-containing protein n=1 Tax=Cyanobium gracile UHCC 0139 TaxID=3110308 RepID=A0ABU5RWH4_9CYAN|nr:hypothetical protein [Cyanobium gracile]MEA5392127.1 hypothetical protein [Cyanobium gracile UHCC 0139]
MRSPAFLDRLRRHDFYAVARRGSFVYCYLRPDGSPYYVGLASYGFRPVHPKSHACGVPADQRLIRVLRSGLTPEQAGEWERRYIARWGRRRDGGILENHLAGGNHGSRRAGRLDPLDALIAAVRA